MARVPGAAPSAGRHPELVIFDCDGVLVDSEVIACRTDAACLAEIGIAITADEIMDRYTGTSVAAMTADLGARYGKTVPADFADILHRRLRAAFETGLSAVTGVEDVLDALSCRVCVASSSTPERLRHSLSLTGLLRYFEPHVFSATQVARGKPAPDLFLFAARTMDATPEACLVIEDSVAGVEAAVAAGMPVYGFVGGGHCRPGHADRLRAAGASALFDRMDRLPGLL
jgi:HAD superfamily hydrolase (TIGR01509 family)